MSNRLVSVIMAGVLLITGLAVAGCPVPATPASPEKANWPEILRLGMFAGGEEAEVRARYGPFAKYLERELGIPVEPFVATDYTAVIEAMRAKKIELAQYGGMGYILAAERANAEAIAAAATADGELSTYHSYIITHPGTGLKSIDDVKRRAGELTFAFVDPASTSGHLIPKGYLLSIGIDPGKDFKAVIFAGSHDRAALAIKARRVDVAGQAVHWRLIEKGKIAAEDVVELWKSPPIPGGPFAVRGDIDPELRRRIQQALLDFAEKDPEGYEQMRWRPAHVDLVAVDDSVYDELRVIARGLGYIE